MEELQVSGQWFIHRGSNMKTQYSWMQYFELMNFEHFALWSALINLCTNFQN